MTVWVSEHPSDANPRQPGKAALASYTVSSGSAGPFPQAGAKYVRVTSDAGGFLCLTSASTATTPTSTNSFRLVPNGPSELFAVSTANRVQIAST